MAICRDVYTFLAQVGGRQTVAPLPPADLQRLAQLGLIQIVGADQYRQLLAAAQSMGAAQSSLAQEGAERDRVAADLRETSGKTHSILFHLHGKETQEAESAREAKDREMLQGVEADLAQKSQAFNDLVRQRWLLDSLTPYDGQYVGITATGAVQLRNLSVRLYRLGDADFNQYWSQSEVIADELNRLADQGAVYFGRFAPGLGPADRAYLWAISIGLAKDQPDPAAGSARFQEALQAVQGLSGNVENRLMAAEILFAIRRPIADGMPALTGLVQEARRAGVAADSALGVAAVLLFGQRADGSFATGNLMQFLRFTRSYESAAVLSIMNVSMNDLVGRVQALRGQFAAWGYEPSEDVELASAYLAVSELPLEGMSTKLALIARGLSTYLQFPLVAAAILASVSNLEANETLNVLEEAYGIIGRRATGFTASELVSLAVRMVHGIRNELVGSLDATAAGPAPAGTPPPGFPPRPMLFIPMLVAHNAYFSTFSGISGSHPGHVHGFSGAFVG